MAKAIWNGVVLAESDKYEVVEGNFYFPSESVKWEYLAKGDRQYTCHWKGEASYWDITVDGKTNRNAAWSYPDPKPAARNIKGSLAFERGKGIKVE
jgi:uncharacterized protein (DUF427 family)